MSKKDDLLADADALARVAGIAKFFQGLASEVDPAHADEIGKQLVDLDAWEKLYRTVADSTTD